MLPGVPLVLATLLVSTTGLSDVSERSIVLAQAPAAPEAAPDGPPRRPPGQQPARPTQPGRPAQPPGAQPPGGQPPAAQPPAARPQQPPAAATPPATRPTQQAPATQPPAGRPSQPAQQPPAPPPAARPAQPAQQQPAPAVRPAQQAPEQRPGGRPSQTPGATTQPGQPPAAEPPATRPAQPAQQPPRPGRERPQAQPPAQTAPAQPRPAETPAARPQQPVQTPAPQPQQPAQTPGTSQPPAQTSPAPQPGQPPQRPVDSAPPRPQQPAQTPDAPPPPAPAPGATSPQQPAQTAPAPQPGQPPQQPGQAPAAGREPRPDPRPGVADQRRIEELQGQRRERVEGRRTVIEEPDRRMIVRENNRVIIRQDETQRFRRLGGDVQVGTPSRGGETRTIYTRPDGVQIITIQDPNGRLIRRSRRGPDGREFVLLENAAPRGSPAAGFGFVVNLPPPRIAIPREQYIVPMEHATEDQMVEVFQAPPLERVARRYTLDEVRYNYNLRARMREVELNTITFETGSWEVTPEQVPLLERMAVAMRRVIERNPNEVFLIEGHTDTTGNDVDNLSLSDRRAESVAVVLTESFQIPAENLTTQGYGSQNLKVPTAGAERANRRVTIRRITPLIAGGAPPPGRPPR